MIRRGRRYQVSDNHLRGLWQILDMEQEIDGKHPIAVTARGRAEARRKCRELNDKEDQKRDE